MKFKCRTALLKNITYLLENVMIAYLNENNKSVFMDCMKFKCRRPRSGKHYLSARKICFDRLFE